MQLVRFGDVRMSDEDERRIGLRERLGGNPFVEDVAKVVHRSAVDQQIIRHPNLIPERVEPSTILRGETLLRPFQCLAREIVEILQTVVLERGEIVIAKHRHPRARANDVQTFVGIGPVADRVAKAEQGVIPRIVRAREDGGQCFEVGMDIRDDGVAQRQNSSEREGPYEFASTSTSASAKAALKRSRSEGLPTETRT